jgi:hypothetical protein
MSIRIDRGDYDPKNGRFRYFVSFSSNDVENDEVHARVPVEVAVSVSETGELADLAFQLPKVCRADAALSLLRNEPTAKQVDSRVFISVPGRSGDTVLSSAAELQVDAAGRILAMNIHPF